MSCFADILFIVGNAFVRGIKSGRFEKRPLTNAIGHFIMPVDCRNSTAIMTGAA